jgi:hypothetical protein
MRDVLTFVITVHEHQRRRDLENVFIVRQIRVLTEQFASRWQYFHFVRHWVAGDEFGDSLWLRIKTDLTGIDELRRDVGQFLKPLENEPYVEKIWEPMVQSNEEVFGNAPSMGTVSGYTSLWCFLDATCRTAVDLLVLDEQGRLDVPEWVVADLWVDFFYNALGVPDFAGCPQCGAGSAMRIPRCHACGAMPVARHEKPPTKM